jgi:hypothetical protein
MTTTLEKPSVEKYQACYLVDYFDNDVLDDLKVLTHLDSIYTDQRLDDEILVSLPLLNVWIETGFLTGNSYQVREQTKQYLTDLYQAIGQETGYIIFRP